MESSFAQRLKFLIEDRKINPAVFARRLDKSSSLIYGYLSGSTTPKIDAAQAILELYPGLNGHWLLTGTGPMWLPEVEATLPADAPGIMEEGAYLANLHEIEGKLRTAYQTIKDLRGQLADKEKIISLYEKQLNQE